MTLAISEAPVDTIGSARAQTSTLDVERLGIAHMTREFDNTFFQPVRGRSVWHGGVSHLSSNRLFTWLAVREPGWAEALINPGSLSTMSSVAVPIALQVMVDALARISYASELPEGWFERGSLSLSDRARVAAIDFVYLLAIEGLLAKGASLDVIPTPIGGIQFEWAGKNGEIEVEIDAQGRFHTLVELPDGSLHESPRSAPVSATIVLPQIKRILG